MDASDVLDRASAAAVRLLRDAPSLWRWPGPRWPGPFTQDPPDPLALPWLAGRIGWPYDRAGSVDPQSECLALLGAGRADEALTLLERHLDDHFRLSLGPFSRAGDDAVVRKIAGLVLRYPRHADVDSRRLVDACSRDELEAVMPVLVRGPDQYGALIGELVIRARDAGRGDDAAEQRWAARATPPWYFDVARFPLFRGAAVRLTARTDVAQALDLLEGWTWDEPTIYTPVDGDVAAIGRMTVHDPARAVAFVAGTRRWWRRLAWCRHLVVADALPAEATPLFESLLARGDRRIDLAVAAIVAPLNDPSWMERAWPSAARMPPESIAIAMSRVLRELRQRGAADRAEALRDQLLSVLRTPRALDLLDAFSTASAPPIPPRHGAPP